LFADERAGWDHTLQPQGRAIYRPAP
jgi:hypothetical protein